MSRRTLLECLSFGFTNKKMDAIGKVRSMLRFQSRFPSCAARCTGVVNGTTTQSSQFGSGFQTGTMVLGDSVLVGTARGSSLSIGILSLELHKKVGVGQSLHHCTSYSTSESVKIWLKLVPLAASPQRSPLVYATEALIRARSQLDIRSLRLPLLTWRKAEEPAGTNEAPDEITGWEFVPGDSPESDAESRDCIVQFSAYESIKDAVEAVLHNLDAESGRTPRGTMLELYHLRPDQLIFDPLRNDIRLDEKCPKVLRYCAAGAAAEESSAAQLILAAFLTAVAVACRCRPSLYRPRSPTAG